MDLRMNPSAPDQLHDPLDTLTAQQVAEILHCAPSTVVSLARDGQLPGAKIGKQYVFVRGDVAAYLRKRLDMAPATVRLTRPRDPMLDRVGVGRNGRRPLPHIPELPPHRRKQ